MVVDQTRLHAIQGRKSKWNLAGTMHRLGVNGKMKCALGLMSGTSLDGIDVALVHTDGQSAVKPGPAMSFAFNSEQRALLRQAILDAKLCRGPYQRPGRLAEIEQEVTELNAAAVSGFLRKTGLDREQIDVIGFHGQTVAHRSDLGFTVQLGDGAMLNELTRRPVVCDMRQNDMQAGGQGAPLAPVYHRALASGLNESPIVVLNLGGVANVTWIGSDDDALLAFDTGPASALIDDWMQAKTGTPIDQDGAMAARGAVNQAALAKLLDKSYFDQPPPKSLDRDAFTIGHLDDLSVADGAATLSEFTVLTVTRAARWFPQTPKRWVVVGGGRHNAHIMERLNQELGGLVVKAEEVGWRGDSVEAEAWAYMAVRSTLGLPITFPGTTGVAAPMTGGRVFGLET